MKPHLDWGIYTNINPNNIKIKLNWAKRRVTNVTIKAFLHIFYSNLRANSCDIRHLLGVITQTSKFYSEHVQ